jgi:hypothetical protein
VASLALVTLGCTILERTFGTALQHSFVPAGISVFWRGVLTLFGSGLPLGLFGHGAPTLFCSGWYFGFLARCSFGFCS